jgi:hypothetical protein
MGMAWDTEMHAFGSLTRRSMQKKIMNGFAQDSLPSESVEWRLDSRYWRVDTVTVSLCKVLSDFWKGVPDLHELIVNFYKLIAAFYELGLSLYKAIVNSYKVGVNLCKVDVNLCKAGAASESLLMFLNIFAAKSLVFIYFYKIMAISMLLPDLMLVC